MDSYRVFRTIIDKYIVAHAKIVGFNATDPHFKPSTRTYTSLAIWVSFALATFYTALTSEIGLGVQNIYFFLFAIQVNLFSFQNISTFKSHKPKVKFVLQGLAKSYVIIRYDSTRRSMIEHLDKLYKANKLNAWNRQIVSKCVRWNMIITKILTLVFLSTSMCSICIPLAIFFKTGKMEPILPAHIPFIPIDTYVGHAIHCAYFSAVIISGYCGTLSNEVFLITLTMHLWAMIKILDQCVVGLNEATSSMRKETVKNSKWLHFRIRNIALMHREIYL